MIFAKSRHACQVGRGVWAQLSCRALEDRIVPTGLDSPLAMALARRLVSPSTSPAALGFVDLQTMTESMRALTPNISLIDFRPMSLEHDVMNNQLRAAPHSVTLTTVT